MAFQSNNKNKRKYDDSENSIIGYEHNLSGNRRNKANTMDYFAFTLLTAPQETRDALLWLTFEEDAVAAKPRYQNPGKAGKLCLHAGWR